MDNFNLTQANNKYLITGEAKVEPIQLQPQSNPIQFQTQTNPVQFQTLPQEEKNEDGSKKLLGTLAALGAIAAAGVGIALAIKKGKNPVKGLSDINFSKGVAKLDSGKNYSGVIQDTLKNGDKITLQYADGVLKKSTRNGSINFEKVYETLEDGSKVVTKTQGDKVVKTNITDIQNAAKDAQKDLEHLLGRKDELDISDFKKQADAISFKSKKQQGEINDILTHKQAVIDEKIAQEEAQRAAQKAEEEAAKKVGEKSSPEISAKLGECAEDISVPQPRKHPIWQVDESSIEHGMNDNRHYTVDENDYKDFHRFIDDCNQSLRKISRGEELGNLNIGGIIVPPKVQTDCISKSCSRFDDLYNTAIPTQKSILASRSVDSAKSPNGDDLLELLKSSKPGDIIVPDSGYGFAFVKNDVCSAVQNDYMGRQINYEILIPEGARIPRNSAKEIILPRNARYEVVDIKPKDNGVVAYLKYII